MNRVVEPELLDALPADDPLARHSRDDLQRVNAWMGNPRILARALPALVTEPKPWRVLDLGAGDGRFLWQVARRLRSNWEGTKLDLLDKQPVISPQAHKGLEQLGWQVHNLRAEIKEWLLNPTTERWTVTCANLFLHHFSQDELQRMLGLISERTMAFVAIEPRRSVWALTSSKMLGLIGCNRVTRHDAIVSVRAGFTGHELSDLWPKNGAWILEERAAGLFSHLFIARRKSPVDMNHSPKRMKLLTTGLPPKYTNLHG